MKFSRAAISLGLITFLYLVMLVWLDSKNHIFDKLFELTGILAVLMGFSVLSYFVRYGRWLWLLRRAGYRICVLKGFSAYLAGFAFTATPGKVGELLRMRYFRPMGISDARIMATFIYERSFDLISVLLIATIAAQSEIFFIAALFVASVITVLAILILNPHSFGYISLKLRKRKFDRLARLFRLLRNSLGNVRVWINPADMCIALLSGLGAWLLCAFSFMWLLSQLDINIPSMTAIGIYPLAMLAGAASMLPGGVGSTEAAIVALLAGYSIPLEQAGLAAIGIRIATLWFAIVCGVFSVILLEWKAQGRSIG